MRLAICDEWKRPALVILSLTSVCVCVGLGGGR